MDTQWLVNLNPPTIYIALSAVVALLIWKEGQTLKKTQGKLPKSKLFHVSSIIDTFWLFVSIGVTYWLDFESVELAVPAAYCLYTVAGWFYGSRLLKRGGMPKTPEELVIPKPYIAFSQSFALIFFALCLFILLTTWNG